MQHRLIATAAIAALGVAALAGCSAQSSDSSSGKVQLTYWTHVNPPAQKVEKELIAAYEKAHPNVKITYLPVDFASLPTKLNSAIAAGSGPDVVNYFQSYAAGLADKGYLAPVDYDALGVSESTFAGDYTKEILNGFRHDGKVLGVPHEISTYQFWINSDDFAKAGLDPVADFPKTWDDVAAVGQKLQAAPGGPREGLSLSLNDAVRDTLIFDAMARQAGQPLFSADGKKASVDSAAAVQALTRWSDFVHKDKVNDPALGPNSATSSDDLFASGTAGMVNTGGTFGVSIYAQTHPDLKYTVGQYPTFGTSQVGADLYGFGLYVPATSKQQKEAWKFVRYLTDKESSAKYFTDAGVWLGDNATLAGPTTASFPHWDVFAEGYKRGAFLAPLANYNQIIQSLENAIQRSVLNGTPASDSLKQAQSEIEPLLAK